MKYIYASALKVIMWLGIEDSSTVRGLELVRHAALCARIEDLKHVVPNLKEEPWSDEQNIVRGFPSRFGADGDGLRPVCSLLSNSYFSRIWIIQETVYATSAVLTLGRYHLDFQDFLNGIRFFLAKHYSLSVRSHNILVQFMIFTSLARVITEDLKFKVLQLSSLLVVTREFRASDPMDKVFALLGLTKNGHLFPVDYESSIEETYTKAAWWFVGEGIEIFHLLAHVEHDAQSFDGKLASWTPRWHVNMLHCNTIEDEKFHAGTLKERAECEKLQDPSILL